MKEAVMDVIQQADTMRFEEVLKSLDVSVGVQQHCLSSVFRKMSDYVYLRCPGVDAGDWQLELSSHQCTERNYVLVIIRSKTGQHDISDMILRKMMICVVTPSREVKENYSLQNKVLKG